MENTPIGIALSGALGHMGQAVTALLMKDSRFHLLAGIDPQDAPYPVPLTHIPQDLPQGVQVLIDFSHPSALLPLLHVALERGIALVLAATGYSETDLQAIHDASRSIPVFHSANMSYGVYVLRRLAREAAALLGDDFDVEIVEKHHRRKLDAPSGTAYMLADALRDAYDTPKTLMLDRASRRAARSSEEIGIVAVRGGSVTGEHEVGFYGDDERITVMHAAESRGLFARGAVRAAAFLRGQPAGRYDMQDILDAQTHA